MIGKIEGTGPVHTSQPIRRVGKTGASGGASFARHLDEASESGSTSSLTGASSVSGILGIQEVDDALSRASRGKLRAQDILDRLDELRHDLLLGALSYERLQNLARIVSAHRGKVDDPRLTAILDEIDLRAQVELAKFATLKPP
ncbi:MAG: flagellar assembly protein FliX [Bdellovibrionales bacterium]